MPLSDETELDPNTFNPLIVYLAGVPLSQIKVDADTVKQYHG